MPLNPKQKRFVEEYLIDLNGAQAAVRAGYSPAAAKEHASRLLTNVNIQEAIQQAKQERSERTQITQDWVLQRLVALSDASLRKVASWSNGGLNLKDSEELTWEEAYSVSEVSVEETIKESEDGKELILHRKRRIKVPSATEKKGTLELLGKHVDLFQDKKPDLPEPPAPTEDLNSLEAIDAIKRITGE